MFLSVGTALFPCDVPRKYLVDTYFCVGLLALDQRYHATTENAEFRENALLVLRLRRLHNSLDDGNYGR